MLDLGLDNKHWSDNTPTVPTSIYIFSITYTRNIDTLTPPLNENVTIIIEKGVILQVVETIPHTERTQVLGTSRPKDTTSAPESRQTVQKQEKPDLPETQLG